MYLDSVYYVYAEVNIFSMLAPTSRSLRAENRDVHVFGVLVKGQRLASVVRDLLIEKNVGW
jgi:hypothetical protein